MVVQKGDILFVTNDNEKEISSLSSGFGGYSYYHCMLCVGSDLIIETIPKEGVIKTKLSKYSEDKILVARTSERSGFIDRVIQISETFIGYKYNDLFLPAIKGKLYCSELIHKSFNIASNTKYFKQHTLNYICPETKKISKYWQELYAEHDLEVPQGKLGSHPNNLSLDDRFHKRFFLN